MISAVSQPITEPPFTPDVIDANVRRLAEKLNVPLVEMGISREYHRKIARNVILLWLKNPLPVIANLACAPCKQHSQKILQIAEKHNIRYVVMGGNKYEAVQLSSGKAYPRSSGGTKYGDGAGWLG